MLHIFTGNKLCVGTATGSLLTYNLDLEADVKTSRTSSKSLSRKPIEQLAYIQDLNSIIVLTGSVIYQHICLPTCPQF